MPNITELIKNDKRMMTLNRGVNASGLDKFLRGRGPFTVFAPLNVAFGKLEKENLEELMMPESKTQLTALLNQHIIGHRVNFKDLKDGDKLKTLNGNELSVKIKDGKVSIDGAIIRNPDIQTSNGIIHSLDAVLIN